MGIQSFNECLHQFVPKIYPISSSPSLPSPIHLAIISLTFLFIASSFFPLHLPSLYFPSFQSHVFLITVSLFSWPPSLRRLTYFSRCVSLVKSPEQQLRACCITRHHRVRFCFGLLQFTNEFFAFLVLSVFLPTPPHFVPFIFSLDLSTEVFLLDKTWCKFASLRSEEFDRRTVKWAAKISVTKQRRAWWGHLE